MTNQELEKLLNQLLPIYSTSFYGSRKRKNWEFEDEYEYEGKKRIFEVETGQRGRRTDHGGMDGESWMSREEIEMCAAPYRKEWDPKLEKLVTKLAEKGHKATAEMRYGEKGHIALIVKITE